ncbi:hypothetical protein BUE80_DR007754 [Diplocarpon rosae]|nr:hypothetical protein BUE80_DR007754 [Diplocarpon rosae]
MKFKLASVAVGMRLAWACLLPEERMGTARTLQLDGDHGLEIGQGDRFSAGTVAPRGVGTQSVTLTSLLSVEEILSGFHGLQHEYDIQTFTTPYTTYEGAAIVGGQVGGAGTAATDVHVYLNAGIHARERGGPDGLLVRGGVASTSPASEVFHGTAPFSEPETQAIKWVMDTFPRVRWFVDLHSYTGDVLYSWGSDENQSDDPRMNFLNRTYDGVRGILGDTPGAGSAYGEYVPADVNAANVGAARRVGAAMSAAAQRPYAVVPASALYATSGASDDYSFSRHFADPATNLIHGYTVEFGFGNDGASCPFYPTQEQHNANVAEIGAGFMELLLAAVEYGLE